MKGLLDWYYWMVGHNSVGLQVIILIAIPVTFFVLYWTTMFLGRLASLFQPRPRTRITFTSDLL